MQSKPGSKLRRFAAITGTTLALSCATAATAASINVAGVAFADQLQSGASQLQLNGAGVRYRVVIKVYAAGLYLSQRASTLEEALAAAGPKQMRIVMLRELEADQISQLFLRGINRNLRPAEAGRLTKPLLDLSAALTGFQRFGKGDVLTIEFDPQQGTTFHAKGQLIASALPGPAVFNAALQIWLGSDPVDLQLKSALLGKPVEVAPMASN